MPMRMKGINYGCCLNVDLSGDLTRKFVAFRPNASWLGGLFLAMLKVFFRLAEVSFEHITVSLR